MGDYAQDDARLALLATGQDEHWRNLYDDFRSPFRLFFLKYTGADPEAVNTLYQDALVVLHRKVVQGQLTAPLQSSLKTYLFGVGKVLYRKQRHSAVQWEDDIPDIPVPAEIEDRTAQREQAAFVQRLLARMDQACRELLEMVYLRGFTMEAVAENLGIPSAGAARKRKFDCLQRMRKLLSQS
ncbi:MAG: sigma-70 family RNA polymerase sigma factor [Lewinella sp.]|nr:sigma-70 family RNA polymerase sigma factor [Lewinella sp.]